MADHRLAPAPLTVRFVTIERVARERMHDLCVKDSIRRTDEDFSSKVSGLFPLVSNFFHDDDNLSAVESLSRRRGMDVQVNFLIGYAFFLSDFIANEGIGPNDRFAPDFVVGFPRHFIPEPFHLLWGTASQELFEVSDAPHPKHRLD